MLKEVIKITDRPPLIECSCGHGEPDRIEHIFEGDGEHLMPVHYVACSHCGRAIGGAHTSAGTACVLWNSRMCS